MKKHQFKLSYIYYPLALIVFVISIINKISFSIVPFVIFLIGFIVAILLFIDTLNFFVKRKNVIITIKELIIYHLKNYTVLLLSFGFTLQMTLHLSMGLGTEAPMMPFWTAPIRSVSCAIITTLVLFLLIGIIEYTHALITSYRQKQFTNSALFKKFSLGLIITTLVLGLIIYFVQFIILAPARAEYRQDWEEFRRQQNQIIIPEVVY